MPRTTRENHQETHTFHLPDYHGLRSSFPTDSTMHAFYHSSTPYRRSPAAPTTPNMQRPTAITHTRFSLIRFRSPLLTKYLFLRVLRCFTSPRHPLHPIHSDAGNQKQLRPGSPIQKPSDHSSFANSPRHIAGYNVFHRPHVPRHPPNALKHLQKTKDARVHYTILNHHTNTTHKHQPNQSTPAHEQHGVLPHTPTACQLPTLTTKNQPTTHRQ